MADNIYELKQILNSGNSFKAEYRYDYSSDILGIKVKRDFFYSETVEVEEGVLLDFDMDNLITALEILEASKKLNIPKYSLKNIIFLKVKVSIDEEFIKLNVIFGLMINNIEEKSVFEPLSQNLSNFPSLEMEMLSI